MFPVDTAEFLRTAFSWNTSGSCFWQSYHYSKVSWGVCSLISHLHMLSSWSKTPTKCCTKNSLLSHDKTISSLLEFIDHVILISECFGKTLFAFNFDEKLTQSVAQTFLPCTLRLVRGFQFQGMIWKMEECLESKNIELKTCQ